jgi:hypothetical protein
VNSGSVSLQRASGNRRNLAGAARPGERRFAGLAVARSGAAGLIDYDVFASIYNEGKFALLASWRDRFAAERFTPLSRAGLAGARHRVVRVVRDYGMFDRRESPQYYPAIDTRSAA